MARIQGRLSKVMVSPDNVTYTEVKSMQSATFNGSRAEIKTTSHDDGAFENYIPGRIDASIDLKLFYDEGDAGQTQIATAWFNGTNLYVKFIMNPGTGDNEYTAQAISTKHTESGGNDDAAMLDSTLRICGTITKSAQTGAPDTNPA